MTIKATNYLPSIILALLLMCGLMLPEIAWAVPAKPGVTTVTQADGTQLNILINGDEYFNWRTTENGDPIVCNEDGYYYYVSYDFNGRINPTTQRVSIDGKMQSPLSSLPRVNMASIAKSASATERAARCTSTSPSYSSSSGFPSSGTIKAAVILVEYSDVSFTVSNPNQAFWNQLNEENYSVEGATGSAKDYFTINSRGEFDGDFDVYGPYKLDNARSYYGGNDSSGNDLRPSEMIWDAVIKADADGVDFSQYDYDNDGYIDNIFVYYAGHNEAEGASSDTIWPHKWVVSSKPEFDGKKLYVYACSSELRGSSGSTIAGIGTFCHEFSHVFGLADHYDTTGTTNGYSYGLGYYDIMTSGSYNNNGNTPPLHNGLELDMIGWNTPVVIDASQNINIEPIQTGEVYKILTDVEDEYFLIENRQKTSTVWDSYTSASGLFITHVDRSSSYMSKWYYNAPNGDTSHECFRFIVAGNVSFSSATSREVMVPYPYNGNDEFTYTSSPAAESWSGKAVEFDIKNITQNSDGSMSFSATYSDEYDSGISIECSHDDIFVGSNFTLSATLDGSSSQSSVSWEVSDSSIVESSIDGNNLIAKFTTEGTAMFTATYSVSGVVQGIKKISLTATTLQGAKGYILDANSQAAVANATINIYPVTRSTSSEYTTTTSNTGEYVIKLDSGSYYEVEVIAAGYASIFEMVYIGEGSNTYNFSMSSYADSVTDISIEATQSSATLIWNPQSYTSFEVSLQNGSTTNSITVENDSKCTFEGLNASTTYSVSVKSGSSSLYSSSFTTMSQTTTIPLIYLEAYEYSAGEVISLIVLNSETTDVISWYYDGTLLQTDKVTLDTTGEHKIKAVVERGSETYNVNREISVK